MKLLDATINHVLLLINILLFETSWFGFFEQIKLLFQIYNFLCDYLLLLEVLRVSASCMIKHCLRQKFLLACASSNCCCRSSTWFWRSWFSREYEKSRVRYNGRSEGLWKEVEEDEDIDIIVGTGEGGWGDTCGRGRGCCWGWYCRHRYLCLLK